MIDAILPAAIVVLTVVSMLSAAILVRAAMERPRIGALTERATVAVVIAAFGFTYSIVVVNTQLAQVLFTTEIGRLAVRLLVVALLSIPAIWTALYLTGRLR